MKLNFVIDKKIEERLELFKQSCFVQNLFAKNTNLWGACDPAELNLIDQSLGWIDIVDAVLFNLNDIITFRDSISFQYRHVVLLGMGGSSLSVEVLRAMLPSEKHDVSLHVLDSIHPDAIEQFLHTIDLNYTLIIVASKSGNTIETLALYELFYDKIKDPKKFIVITDSGSYLEKLAQQKNFLKIFLNPQDIGGRFSALSYFGVVPAVLSYQDMAPVLLSAKKMDSSCKINQPISENPGVMLGTIMGEMALAKKNQLTLLVDQKHAQFTVWIEQLVAESSGKNNIGIVPIINELEIPPSHYSNDRLFIRFVPKNKNCEYLDKHTTELIRLQHPVVDLYEDKSEDIGGAFFLWEVATAVACSIIRVNAFNQPDVQAAKLETKALLGLQDDTDYSKLEIDFDIEKDTFSAKVSHALLIDSNKINLSDLKHGGYISLLSFSAQEDGNVQSALQSIQKLLSEKTTCAVTQSYGPRYLHSTGQLHKGGQEPNVLFIFFSGCFKDRDILKQSYTFGDLGLSQAYGDFLSLSKKNRKVVFFFLKDTFSQSMQEIHTFLNDCF